MNITVTHDDGSTEDITELVQIAYDVAVHSMDWGSGFLDVEETSGLVLLSHKCGFPDFEEVVAEEWRNRMKEGKRHDELQRIAHERGAKFWWQAKPTDEERARIIEGMQQDVQGWKPK